METRQDKPPLALVIEDDPGHQRMLEICVKRSGCDCTCAFDGRSGLETAQSRPFDIIFVDIHIPDLDGFIVASKLRDGGSAVPLIAVSALKLEGLEKKALSVGYNEFLRKPVDQKTVQGILDRYVFGKKTDEQAVS